MQRNFAFCSSCEHLSDDVDCTIWPVMQWKFRNKEERDEEGDALEEEFETTLHTSMVLEPHGDRQDAFCKAAHTTTEGFYEHGRPLRLLKAADRDKVLHMFRCQSAIAQLWYSSCAHLAALSSFENILAALPKPTPAGL